MKARDIMTTPIVSIRSDATVDQAIEIMLNRCFSGLPVVDDEGRLVGIVTEGDLLRRQELGTQPKHSRWLRLLISPGRLAEEFARSRGRQVADVMTPEVHSVSEDSTLEDIVELMLREGIKRVPVVVNGGPVGMVTRADILRALRRSFTQATFEPSSDSQIAVDIQAAFEAAGDCIPTALIEVSVTSGVVELHGSITDERERQAVKVAIEGVRGVKEVHDHLMWIEPMSGMVLPSPQDLAEENADKASAA
ncbi:CBS domain-containing protein [Enterovirga sp.]|uniref:CBS domain-containing protein n=1 Tax=Enterovirga sp. TaxID=2026350 RepID=UPI002CB9030D|nr:CBS domain-containing protein [Enterovirga sp.]HMO30500.1 CBS domain-containing protein [Enterovirga sp.]